MIPEVKAAQFHREIMFETRELQKRYNIGHEPPRTPNIWMSEELYKLLLNDLYYGDHFAIHDFDLKYFGCPVKVVDLPGYQYIVGFGVQRPVPAWDQLEEMTEEEKLDQEAEHEWFIETVKNWARKMAEEQRKENT